MFPSLAEREIYVAETNFAARPKENAFALGQEHFCLAYTKFASETCFPVLSGNMARNNVS